MLPSICVNRTWVVIGLCWFVDYELCNRRKKVYFVVMMWARYLNNNYCDCNLMLAFNTYTYFLEYNVIVI